MTTFADTGLSENLLRAVSDKGYDTPSPIQAQAIPAVLARKDMIAAAQTGTGKTAGFTLPMMQILDETGDAKPSRGRPIRALVLTPTRELAAQVEKSIEDYGKYLQPRSMVVYGGVKIRPQIRKLPSVVEIPDQIRRPAQRFTDQSRLSAHRRIKQTRRVKLQSIGKPGAILNNLDPCHARWHCPHAARPTRRLDERHATAPRRCFSRVMVF